MDPVFPSPTGRYQVAVEPWEAKMSHWVECPQVQDLASGRLLFRFPDHLWSMDSATWLDDTTVRLGLRKYPGGHLPPTLWVTIDCQVETATLGGGVVALAELASHAEAALSWASRHPGSRAAMTAPNQPSPCLQRLRQRLAGWFRRGT